MTDAPKSGHRRAARLLLRDMRAAYEREEFAPPTFAAAELDGCVLVVAAGWRADELRTLIETEWDGAFQDASTEAKRNGTWTVAAARRA